MTDHLPQAHLPLSPTVFHILLALADQDRHGYAIIKDVLARTDNQVHLSAGTLYSNLKRLLEDGLIKEIRAPANRIGDDQRRRYYALTELGRAVAQAELSRLEEVVRQAHAFGLKPSQA